MSLSQKLWRNALLLTVLVGLGFWAQREGLFGDLLDRHKLADLLAAHGATAFPLLIVVGALYTAVGGPRQMLALAFGFVFGGFSGAVFYTVITLLGCLLTVVFARQMLSEAICSKYPRQVRMLQGLLDKNAWLSILVIRLLPVGSNLLTNMFAGAARIRLLPMMIGSFIGYLPQMLIFSYAGAGIGWSDQDRLLFSGVLLVVSTLVAGWLYHSNIRKQIMLIQSATQETEHG